MLDQFQSLWIQSAFGNTSINTTPQSTNKRHTSESRERLSTVHQTKTSAQWVDKYSPKSVSGLAIHKKKAENVYDWMSAAVTVINMSNNILESAY
jgi:hypothetical protein